MTALSQKDLIENIRLHNDIVETIERYVPVKKMGGRFKALCPFHKEKTPSFQIDPDKQLFHCFGCGAGGDVFSFVMQYENVDFKEAARMLAERAGIRFEAGPSETAYPREDKQALYALHEDLAQFYAETLRSDPAAAHAREYVAGRDLSAVQADFQLGFAPVQNGAITRWAEKKKHPMALLEKAGVVLPSDRGGPAYDRFKGRLMFPIRDEQSRVVAFSGRLLDASSQAKYVNSPETLLFKKGRVLYGLDRARQAIVEKRQALLCEGQIDVIRCHAAGFPLAVAPQGTALTEAHALLLKRYADEVLFLFDGDTAGQNATLRGAELLLAAGLSIRVIALPEGEDPDTLIRAQGPHAFEERLNSALSLVAYHVQILREREDLDSQAGRMRAIRAVLATIQHAPSAVLRDQYLQDAARLFAVKEDALRQDLYRLIRPSRAGTPADQRAATLPPVYPPNETGLIELLVAHPEVLDLVHQYVPPDTITNPTCRTVIQTIMSLPEPDATHLMNALSDADEACRRLTSRLIMTARSVAGEEVSCLHAAQDIILKLRIQKLDREIRDCLTKLTTATPEDQRVLINESAQLTLLKKRLQQGWSAAEACLESEH